MDTPSLFVNRNDSTYSYRIGSQLYDTFSLSQLYLDIRDPNAIEIHGPFHIDPQGSQLLFIETMNDFLLYQQQSNGQFVESHYSINLDEEEDEVRGIHIFKVPTQRGVNGVFEAVPLRQIDPSLINQIRILCSGVPLTNQIYRRILNILNYSNQPRTVYVYGLDPETTIDQIRDLFEQFITESVRFEDGVGIVTFVNAFDVNGSILMLNNTLLNGDAIQVTNQRLQSFTLYIYGVNNSETSLEVSRLARTFGHVRFELSSPNEIIITYDNYQESVNALEAMNGFRLIEISRMRHIENNTSDVTYVRLYLYELPNITNLGNLRFIEELFGQFVSVDDIRLFNDYATLNIDVNEVDNAINIVNGFGTVQVTREPRPREEPVTVYVYNVPFGTHANIFRTLFDDRARDFSLSEGTASMVFDNPQVAENVINEMNGRQYGRNVLEVTRTPHHIRNYPPQSDPNAIYVYNLNPSIDIGHIEHLFDRFNPGMINISDGSAQIEFSNSQDADLAIQTMNFTRLMGGIIHVTREYPRGQMVIPEDYNLRESPTTVYVHNLNPVTTTSSIRQIFGQYGNIQNVNIFDGTASMNFENDRIARSAILNMNGSRLDGNIIVVSTGIPNHRREEPELPPQDNLMKESYETYMRQVYNLPVTLPEFLIINGLRVPFISFSEVKDIQIERYVIEPILQPWSGPPSGLSSDKPANRIVTIFGKNGMTYLVKAKYDQVNNQIFQPV